VVAGTAVAHGNAEGLRAPVAGLALHPNDNGYWMVTADGSVLAFGNASTHGAARTTFYAPIEGIASSRTGNGYFVVSTDGHVQAFGDAHAAGDAPHPDPAKGGLGQLVPARPSVGIASNGAGGYWIVDENGAVRAFGGAPKLGGTGNLAMLTP
jgi:hypothetical protein